jgi:hypothetical protein
MLIICIPPEQDVVCTWFPVQLLPGKGVWPRRVFIDVLLDRPDSPVGKRHDPFTVTLGKCEYVATAEVLDLASAWRINLAGNSSS